MNRRTLYAGALAILAERRGGVDIELFGEAPPRENDLGFNHRHLGALHARFGTGNDQFGFNIAWAAGRQVVIESSTSLDTGAWWPLRTNVLATDMEYFSDPDWTKSSARMYRVRAP